MRLLIVDDHAAMRRLLSRVVNDLFSVVVECEDGADALAAYERHRPDWVFMDIEMSQMDGITATRDIRQVFPEARIVIVSKHDDKQLRAAALTAGACGYVLKDNLIAVRELLERSSRSGHSP
jgi:DNA-binding NarL/FixJ family response regulator